MHDHPGIAGSRVPGCILGRAGTSAAPGTRGLGQSLVEFALVLPILMFIFAGAVDMGRLFYAFVAVDNAAREGAMFGSRNPICATSTSSNLCADPENAEWRIRREAANITFAVATPSCLAPDGSSRASSPSSPTANCRDGDTYVAGVSHQFVFITPILSSILGTGIVLASESRSTVVNEAFDPTAGATPMLTVSWAPGTDAADCTELGGGSCFGRSPRTNAAEQIRTLTVANGTAVTYRIVVTNGSGKPLTGVAVAFAQGATGFNPGCTFPTSMGVGYTSPVCEFTRTLTWVSSAPVEVTATVTANEQRPAMDGVQVIVQEPPRFTVSLQQSPFREGLTGAAGSWATTPLAAKTPNLAFTTRSGGQTPSAWYFLRIQNTGNVTGSITSIGLTEKVGAGAATSILTQCTTAFPTFVVPRTLAPGTSIDCWFSRTRSTAATVVVTATATGSGGAVISSAYNTATVATAACSGTSNRQVQNLVDSVTSQVNGTTTRFTVAQARSRWTTPGFTGAFTPATAAGFDARPVFTQSRAPYTCIARTSTVTVTYGP